MTAATVVQLLVFGVVAFVFYALGAYERRRTASWDLALEIADALDEFDASRCVPFSDEAVTTARAMHVARWLTGTDPARIPTPTAIDEEASK